MIRGARLDERDAIAAFIDGVIAASVDAPPDEKAGIAANVLKNLDKWQAQPAQCVHLVAEEGGQLVGEVLVRDFWNLCTLFVAPAMQGRGIGRTLVDAALARCAGRSPHGKVRLNATRNAIGFYRHLGFTERTGTAPLGSSLPMECDVGPAPVR